MSQANLGYRGDSSSSSQLVAHSLTGQAVGAVVTSLKGRHRLRPPGQRAGWRYERLLASFVILSATLAYLNQSAEKLGVSTLLSPLNVLCITASLACATAFVTLRAKRISEDVKWAQQVEDLLSLNLSDRGQLPSLSLLSPYRLGVSPSRYGNVETRHRDVYVKRSIDDKLDQDLQSGSFILIVGDSKAGKSRTAYEAACRLLVNGHRHDPGVLVPKTTTNLPKILSMDPPIGRRKSPSLLWLDDLTEGELGGLTPDTIDRLQKEFLVLGTMTAQRLARIESNGSEVGRTGRQALTRAKIVRLDSELTHLEKRRAQAAYPEESFEVGIGEQLVAADKLLTQYVNARQGADPHAWAVVQAAIDWVRMDIGYPIRVRELQKLYPFYLRTLRPTAQPRSDLSQALDWACQPAGGRIALLQPIASQTGSNIDAEEVGYRPFDFLVGANDGQHEFEATEIPDYAWDRVPYLVNPQECSRAALSAYYRNEPAHACRLFAAVVEGTDTQASAKAMVNLAHLLLERGESAEALGLFQRAIDSEHPDAAPAAMLSLARVVASKGDLDRARLYYEEVLIVGSVHLKQAATARLAVLDSKLGNHKEAELRWRELIAAEHQEWTPRAMVNLAWLLEERGDILEAAELYEEACSSGHPDEAPRAMVNLAALMMDAHDYAAARKLYDRAIQSDHPDESPRAMTDLGWLLAKQGSRAEAEEMYRQAIASGHLNEAPRAIVNLGQLLKYHGEPVGAERAFREAVALSHGEAAPRAMLALAELLNETGDSKEASQLLERAAACGHSEIGPLALVKLAVMATRTRETTRAREMWRKAIATGHRELAPAAMVNLGWLLLELNDQEGAAWMFTKAARSGNPTWAAVARERLHGEG